MIILVLMALIAFAAWVDRRLQRKLDDERAELLEALIRSSAGCDGPIAPMFRDEHWRVKPPQEIAAIIRAKVFGPPPTPPDSAALETKNRTNPCQRL